MKNFTLLVQELYSKQREFGYLEAISLFRENCEDSYGSSGYFLQIILSAYPLDSSDRKLKLNFSGVRNLKIGEIDALVKVLVSIVDISANQLEDIKYSVKDDEHDLFSFYCNYFSFEEVIIASDEVSL